MNVRPSSIDADPPGSDSELRMLSDSIGRFLDASATPAVVEAWKREGRVSLEFWRKAAQAGLLGLSIPEAYGGAGGDFRHEAVLTRELYLRGLDAFAAPLHNAICVPYICAYATEEQKARWLPGLVDGSFIAAVAMTEPGAGSDLKAIRTRATPSAHGYVINGQKTFISSGQNANFIIVVCKTGSADSRGMSLIVVETERVSGFRRGRNLEKLGLEAADTSELFFDDVEVGADAVLGGVEGVGFQQLMQQLPQERLLIAVQGLATIDRALAETIAYTKSRHAFGKALIDFQNTQFKLAECKTKATIAKVFVDHCIDRLVRGGLDAATASMAKYWVSEIQCEIVDECLQLHGGYGYMQEYPIAQMYRDSRIQRIYGGANEIMKMLIARTL